MAGRGKKVTFHGAFKHKRDAVKKEKSIGGFIRATLFCRQRKCSKRYLVMKER